VVDAKYVVRNISAQPKDTTLENVNEAVQQIAFGDLILINKIDIVDREELALAKKTVRAINRNAWLLDCQLNQPDGSGCPDVSQILNVDSFSLEKIQQFDPSFMDSDSDGDGESDLDEGFGRHGAAFEDESSSSESDEELRETRKPKRKRRIHHDNMGICSIGVTARGPLHQWRFNMFMKDFFSERAEDIFRSKGILCIKVSIT